MQEHSKKQNRRGKLLGGALVGAVLSLGVVAGSASAAPRPSADTTDTVVSATLSAEYTASAQSGIRW